MGQAWVLSVATLFYNAYKCSFFCCSYVCTFGCCSILSFSCCFIGCIHFI